jgi:LPS export ABC transporter protein LptC
MRRAEARRLLSRAALFGAVLFGAAFTSCSLGAYGAEAHSDEEMPTAFFSHYSHTVVDKGKTLLELKAATAAAYESSKKMVLTDVVFSEYDTSTGEIVSSGRAAKVVYHTDTKDAEFSGSVRLESKSQDAVLEGESLAWSDKDKRLEGGLEYMVKISRSDGSAVSGSGFEAETRSRSFAFRDSVEGRIEESKKEPAEASPNGAPEGAP